jgi:hypothetical protein
MQLRYFHILFIKDLKLIDAMSYLNMALSRKTPTRGKEDILRRTCLNMLGRKLRHPSLISN